MRLSVGFATLSEAGGVRSDSVVVGSEGGSGCRGGCLPFDRLRPETCRQRVGVVTDVRFLSAV